MPELSRSAVAGSCVCLAAVGALLLLRDTHVSDDEQRETPAASALPASKLRLFYGALLVDTVLVMVGAREVVLYLTLLLVFASVPILGHQTIGLTPARARSSAVRRWWLLGLAFPLISIALGLLVLTDARA